MAKYATHKAPHVAKLLTNRRLTAPDWEQDVRHLELDVSGADDLTYQAGDVAVVMPRNDKAEAEAFLGLVGLEPDAVLEFRVANPETETETGPRPRPVPVSALPRSTAPRCPFTT